MANKPVILTFIGYYLPGYKSGGPVRTISNMLKLLANNYVFKIITRDRDLLEKKQYKNIKVNEWNLLPDCQVFYYNLKQSLSKIINITNFDVYYLNSLFDYNFSIKVILLHRLKLIPQRQIILAPRGELFEAAISNKFLLKKLFLFVVKVLSLYKDVIWHASSEYEENLIKKEFGQKIKTRVALDVPYDSFEKKIQRVHKKKNGELKILFISRIAKTKNLKFVIKVLNSVNGNFSLDIYGPIVDRKYWIECNRLISPNIKDKISYKGIIDNAEINSIYPNYDLLFFPTLGESFGHVIFESLSFGTPVLCADLTPWQNLEKYNAGWNLNLNDFSNYVKLIEYLISIDELSYKKFIDGCEDYINMFKTEKNILQNNIKLFEI